MTASPNIIAKSGRGGAGRGQGRKVGIPNKATLEKALIAKRTVDDARASGKKLAKEVLEDYMFAFNAVAAHYQRNIVEALKIGGQPAKVDLDGFERWGGLTTRTGADLAKYQSPTFKAIQVTAPTPEMLAIPLQDGNVITIDDPEALIRVYKRRISQVD